MKEEIIKEKMGLNDRRHLLRIISEIKSGWVGGQDMEYGAMEYAIEKYAEKLKNLLPPTHKDKCEE